MSVDQSRPAEKLVVGLIFLAASLAGACAPSDSGPTPEGAAESLPSSAPAQPGATFLFEGARLILGDGGMIENGALLVEGDRILAVGGTEEVTAPTPVPP